MDPTTIPQFVDQLPHFAGLRITGPVHDVIVEETRQFALPAAM
jgi:hypothetical protein